MLTPMSLGGVSIPLSSSVEPSTLVRTMMRYVPKYFGTKALREPDAKQFTGLVLETGTADDTKIIILQDK